MEPLPNTFNVIALASAVREHPGEIAMQHALIDELLELEYGLPINCKLMVQRIVREANQEHQRMRVSRWLDGDTIASEYARRHVRRHAGIGAESLSIEVAAGGRAPVILCVPEYWVDASGRRESECSEPGGWHPSSLVPRFPLRVVVGAAWVAYHHYTGNTRHPDSIRPKAHSANRN